jgi:hypothetical protein
MMISTITPRRRVTFEGANCSLYPRRNTGVHVGLAEPTRGGSNRSRLASPERRLQHSADQTPKIWGRHYRGDKCQCQRGLGLGLVNAVVESLSRASSSPAKSAKPWSLPQPTPLCGRCQLRAAMRVCPLFLRRRTINCVNAFGILHTAGIDLQFVSYGQLAFIPRHIQAGFKVQDGPADLPLRHKGL